jgi:hypothetical protein
MQLFNRKNCIVKINTYICSDKINEKERCLNIKKYSLTAANLTL